MMLMNFNIFDSEIELSGKATGDDLNTLEEPKQVEVSVLITISSARKYVQTFSMLAVITWIKMSGLFLADISFTPLVQIIKAHFILVWQKSQS